MDILDENYNSIEYYFSLLKHTGYIKDSQVMKLLVFSFIVEMLYGDMSYFITEEDYNSITDALYCIYGSCMISFPDYKKAVSAIKGRLPDEFRITESNILRDTEDTRLRVKS